MQDTLVMLIQYIKNILFLRFKIVNKISKRELFFKFCNFKESFYNQKQKRTILTNKIYNIFATISCRKNTSRLLFCNLERINNVAQDKRICYNCKKKKYIAKDYFKFLKKTQIK